MKWRIEIEEASILPRGYGIAYWRWECARAVCFPVPLNIIVCWARLVDRWFRFPPGRLGEKRLRASMIEYGRGAYGNGYRDGYRAATLEAGRQR